jgi:acylpyruvate hydrolase
MKLLTFRAMGERTRKLGAVSSKGLIVDLASSYAFYLFEKGEAKAIQLAGESIPHDMIEFIEKGEIPINAARIAIDYAESIGREEVILGAEAVRIVMHENEIEFFAPLARPGKMMSVGANYEDHLVETGLSAPEFPMAFAKLASAFVGHKGGILHTKKTLKMDYEIELAFVIGKKGKYIPKNEAMDYVYGYTIFNDISERGLQLKEMKMGTLLGGKNMDCFAPLGPYLVTKDEIEDPHSLELELRVNGKVRQHSNTKRMIYRIEDVISYWSSLMTLWPGDIFSTGTPSGVAIGHKSDSAQYYLRPGDIVEAEIEGIGILTNSIVPEERRNTQ